MAEQRPPTAPKTLREMLLRKAGQRSVLGVVIPIIDAALAALRAGVPFEGASEDQIKVGFASLAAGYLHCDFSTSYLSRRVGRRDLLELNGELYRFRSPLGDGVTVG